MGSAGRCNKIHFHAGKFPGMDFSRPAEHRRNDLFFLRFLIMLSVSMKSRMSWIRAGNISRKLTIVLPENAISTVGGFAGKHSTIYERVSMTEGTVKWFNSQKGFGFIAPDDGGRDAFVHISAVERSGLGELHEGQKVAFELVADRKSGKMSAENLKALA